MKWEKLLINLLQFCFHLLYFVPCKVPWNKISFSRIAEALIVVITNYFKDIYQKEQSLSTHQSHFLINIIFITKKNACLNEIMNYDLLINYNFIFYSRSGELSEFITNSLLTISSIIISDVLIFSRTLIACVRNVLILFKYTRIVMVLKINYFQFLIDPISSSVVLRSTKFEMLPFFSSSKPLN